MSMKESNEWLAATRKIVEEGKKIHNKAEDVLAYCEKKGLIISYPDTFKRVYGIGDENGEN